MKKNNKTIGLKIYFFTNDLPAKIGKNGKFTPCWEKGMVYLENSGLKGIMFNSQSEIQWAVGEMLSKAKILPIVQ